jgi:hypothetical protein
VTGFVGFEQSVVYSEESRDPRRTVPRATYLAVALIAVLYRFAAWDAAFAAWDAADAADAAHAADAADAADAVERPG